MPAFVKGAWHWFESPLYSWIPLKLASCKDGKIVARSHLEDEVVIDESLALPAVNPSSLVEIDNMVEMQELSEAAILHNLRLRFMKDSIYTYISSILVSVNPFKLLPIYTPTIMADYRTKLSAGARMPPHVYAVADAAFKQMTINGKNQSVIISGESGAGKTEATKLVLQYMAEMSGQSSEVEQQLLEANPIVEAFGNAKTVRNNNSSRFGKWVEITFNQRFHIVGAQLITYLLEQSRIVAPGQGERNYHIFYQLCQGLSTEQREAWKIGEADAFRVCNAGGCLTVSGNDEVREFKEMMVAMDVLKFSQQERTDLLRTVCAVMHLGNIEFAGTDQARVENQDVLTTAATLLGVNIDTLSQAMVSQTKSMGKEKVRTLLSKSMAEGNRDALCKAVYSNQFLWLVQRLNKSMYKTVECPQLVGVLDIFGFEIFETNRFEQFCINFTNEKMQQHFNEHIFIMEQAEYRNEHIDVAHVSFQDNQECLNMIEKGRDSILAMCDDELKVPQCTDETLLARLNNSFKNHKYFAASKKKEPIFGVVHYAGQVDYSINGFLVKNLNKLSPDLAEVIRLSSHSHVRELAPDPSSVTVGSKFKTQLNELMTELQRTQPHFIRCIKSNNLKVADTFDAPFVLRQLRYLGLKEVVNIRQLGYPIRSPAKEFCDRYRLVAPPQPNPTDWRECARGILTHVNLDPQHWRVGDKKVFLRHQIREELEKRREAQLVALATNLQALGKAKAWRTRYLKLRIVEKEMKVAVEGEDSKLLDDLISRYEVLQMNLNPRLLTACVSKRNFLIKREAAERALKAAIKSKDLQLLRSAIAAASEVGLSEGKLCQQAQQLAQKIAQMLQFQELAIEKRDLNATRQAVLLAGELGIDSATEKQMVYLLKALEAEAKVKDSLAKAMESRDLTALRHALQVAMNHRSGPMVGNALQRALDAGLQNDALVKKAIELEKTLDREVSVAKMAAELQAALDADDLDILQSTVKLAQEPKMGLGDHPLTLKCLQKIATILKVREIVRLLLDATASKDMTQLERAITEAERNGLARSDEYASAVNTRDEILNAMRKVKEAQEQAERLRIAAAEKAAAAREEEKRLGIIRATEQKAEEARLSKLAEEKERAHLDEALAAARALGAANDQVMKAAVKEQEKRKLEDEVRQVLQTAIGSNDVNLLKNAIGRAQAVGLPTTDEDYANARGVLKDLQAQSMFRDQELKEAEEAVQTRTVLPEPAQPVEEVKESRPSDAKEGEPRRVLRPRKGTEQKRSKELPEEFVPMTVSREEYSQEMYEISHFPGLKLVSEFVKSRRSTVGAKTDKLADKLGMLRYTKELLPCALTRLPDPKLEQTALEIFKSVQGFMNDRHYSFPDSLVCEIVEILVDTPALRNETYCQVIKQLDHNPRRDGRLLAWMLLSLLAEHVPPQPDCVNYVLHCTVDPDLIFGGEQYAEYVAHTLSQTVAKPVPPKEPGVPVCSVEKVTAFRNRSMKPSEVVVYLPDGSKVKTTMKPWMNTATLLPIICKQLGFVDLEGLAIYELKDNLLTRIEDKECLLDYQLQWGDSGEAAVEEKTVVKKKRWNFFAKKEDPARAQVAEKSVKSAPRFVVLRRLLLKQDGESSDPLMRKVLAFQTARDWAMGLFGSQKEEEVVAMAAWGRRLLGLPLAIPTATQGWRLALDALPPPFDKVPTFNERVKAALADPQFTRVLDRELVTHYLSLFKDRPLFGVQAFQVQNADESSDYSSSLIFAVSLRGVYLVNADTFQLEAHFPLTHLKGWTATSILVTLGVRLDRRNKAGMGRIVLRLLTNNLRMGKEICALLLDNCNLMMKLMQANSSEPRP